MWVGPLAYSGWDNTNYQIHAGTDGTNLVARSYTFTAVAGQYIPFRVHFGNLGYAYGFSVSITGPDGAILASGTTQTSNSIVQFSCDNTTAPPFPSLYQECTNQGYEVAYHYSYPPFQAEAGVDVNPAYFKAIAPRTSDVGEAGIFKYSDTCSTYVFYGPPQSCNYFYVTYRGYIYATQTGVYTITVPPNADDRAWVWMGPLAYSGYNSTNYLVETSYSSIATTSGSTASFTVTRVGQYIPWRVGIAQRSGPWYYYAIIRAPDGTILVSSDNTKTIDNNNIVRFTCDGVTAPRFPAFGSET